jgi:sec-independent protein translocase protein TatB
MFDISWTEFLLIAVVALIFIGPKELPGVLRTMGQWTRRVRSMASDFQSQFQEAMREAEMSDLKKQVDDIAHDIKRYDPLKDVRTDVEAAGKDIKSSLEKPPSPEQESALEKPVSLTPADEPAPVAAEAPVAADAVPAPAGEGTPPGAEQTASPPSAPAPKSVDYSREAAVVAAAIAPVVPQAVESAPEPDTTGHGG